MGNDESDDVGETLLVLVGALLVSSTGSFVFVMRGECWPFARLTLEHLCCCFALLYARIVCI